MANTKMPGPEELGKIGDLFKAAGLKTKLLYTFAMLVLFRLGAQIPVSGIDSEKFKALAQGNNIIGFLDLFSGGALGSISIFALGIGPYITASIIMQLLTAVIPQLESLQKEEGEAGRRQIQQYTRYFTVILAIFQSIVLLSYVNRAHAYMGDVNLVLFNIGALCALVTGAVLVMYLGELITEKGIGNGGSLLIFFGILASIPVYASRTWQAVSNDPTKQFALIVLLGIFVATIIMVVIMHEAVRKIIIVNARRQVGNKVYGGGNTHIPFKINPGGVMPIIFAVAILLFPATVIGILQNVSLKAPAAVQESINFLNMIFNPGSWTYNFIYFALIVFLTFFYASIMPNMQPKDIANNLKKYGSAIPGIKPGKPTADYLDTILSRVTFIGAMGLGIVALIPSIATTITQITTLQGIGATAIIIIVGVALDTVNQIRTHMLSTQYEGFLKQ
jgi:preprotein translocase subunit SecY